MNQLRIFICLFIAMLLSPASLGQALPDWAIGPFVRPDDVNPVIKPDPTALFDCPMREKPVHWEALHTFNPAAVVYDGKINVLYRAEDDSGTMAIGMHTSRLGLAQSSDGLHFTRPATPSVYPAVDDQKKFEWDGGCEDPRLIVADTGSYILTYTQWDRKTARLAVATSPDLQHWQKHGPAFLDAYHGKYADLWSKSGSIVGKLQNGTLTAAKLDGKYWMYWGEGDVHLASSDDLIHWTPLENADGKLVIALAPRPGKFDSALVEGGPAALLTDRGIVVIYNGKAHETQPSADVGLAAYSGGQALFDAHNPANLLARLDHPFFKPETPIEKSGQYTAGTTFLEGLVHFKGDWFLYYGCADSFVGVAIHRK